MLQAFFLTEGWERESKGAVCVNTSVCVCRVGQAVEEQRLPVPVMKSA